jgi:hypothetical protein
LQIGPSPRPLSLSQSKVPICALSPRFDEASLSAASRRLEAGANPLRGPISIAMPIADAKGMDRTILKDRATVLRYGCRALELRRALEFPGNRARMAPPEALAGEAVDVS